MAAIRPDGFDAGTTIEAEEAYGAFRGTGDGLALSAFQHVLVPFRTQLVDDNDTYDPGSATAGGNVEIGIVKVAWEPSATTDPV